MNWDYDCRVVQSIILLPNWQFLIEGSLEGNMFHLEGLIVEVSFRPLLHVFLSGFWISSHFLLSLGVFV